jgi:GTP pyrophosphokinase
MASLDFELEKINFRIFYENNRKSFNDTKNAYIRIIGSLVKRFKVGEVTKIEGRVKEKEECIKKFRRKYLNRLEVDEQSYEIKDFISDLIGIRIICLYDDQISQVSEMLQQHFTVLEITDKISSVQSTEDFFGYKGLHMDMVLNEGTSPLARRYRHYANRPFEVQIRSLIQDAWSVLDHKIKYKKSIPLDLKRRINILSALFELADQEFTEIRNATTALMQLETSAPIDDFSDDVHEKICKSVSVASIKTVNVFNFLRIAGHFFRDFQFEDYKVDSFVHDILKLDNSFKKSDLHRCLMENLKTVKEYRDFFMAENNDSTFSPYTSIRHCLYLGYPQTFDRILSKVTRERFSDWLNERGQSPDL